MKTGIFPLLVVASVLVAGCGSSDSPAEEPSGRSMTAAAGSTTPEDTTSDAPALVGRWRRVNECPELVKALDQAGLRAIAPAVAGDFFPEASPRELARKDDLCAGAEPIVHYHFFDEAGAFGSLDENEDQVDDGTYEIIDDRTFVISKEFPDVTFHYSIEGGGLSLSPVLTPALKRDALAHPLEFSAAGWSISVSYPGHTWERVSCGGWC
jgi:hypothetical protein